MFTKGPKQAGWYPAAQNISAVFGRCGRQPFADSRTRCPPPENVSRHIAGHIALIFMLRRIPPGLLLLSWLFYYNKRHNQNGTGKSWKSWLLSVPFWLCLSFLSGANTVEAGYPGIPRSINMGIRVRLCSDWCLREADILSDYPQTAVSCIARTQYPYFAQRYAGITGFGPLLVLTINFYLTGTISIQYPSGSEMK